MLFLFVHFFLIFFFGNGKAFIGKNEKNRLLGYPRFSIVIITPVT